MITFFACQKESNLTTAGTERSKTLSLPESLSDTNKKALQAFFDGSADRDATTGTFRAGFSELATVQNGILHFANTAAIYTFTDRMQTLKATWNYTQNNDPIRDAAVMSVEQTLGYTSLNSQYKIQENNNVVITDRLGDPDLLTILNEQKEAWVADTIYKYLVPGVALKIVNSDFTALNKARQRGWDTYADNVYLLDERTGKTTFRGTNAVCGFKVTLFDKTDGTLSPNATIKISAVDAAGNILNNCAVKTSINWGDGKALETKSFTGSVFVFHSYSLGANQTKDFQVTVTGQGILECETTCTTMTSGTLTIPFTTAMCSSKRFDKSSTSANFTVAGKTFFLATNCGQRGEYAWYSKRKIWADADLRLLPMSAKPAPPGSIVSMSVVGIGGSTFDATNSCSGTSSSFSFPSITTSAGTLRERVIFSNNFSTTSDPAFNPMFRFVVNVTSATSADLVFVRGLW